MAQGPCWGACLLVRRFDSSDGGSAGSGPLSEESFPIVDTAAGREVLDREDEEECVG